VLKDEPEDLTHLAPTAGDVCVPLEDTPFLSDMLDEFIFGNDNYGCPLLSPGDALTPELRSADLSESLKDADLVDTGRTKDAADRLADSDPFMYGDSPGSPCSIDPNTVSPSLSKYQQVSDEKSQSSIKHHRECVLRMDPSESIKYSYISQVISISRWHSSCLVNNCQENIDVIFPIRYPK